MSEKRAIGRYNFQSKAKVAFGGLDKDGFQIEQASIAAQDKQGEKEMHGDVINGDIAWAGASIGACFGGLFGLLACAVFNWAPGFGPLTLAGPFAALILCVEGLMTGAACGGLLGAGVSWGISRQHFLKYEEQ